MTCIAAVTDGKTIVIGGDSAGVGGLSLTVRDDRKVFKRAGEPSSVEWSFGFTSSFRMGQLIQYELELPKVGRKARKDLFGFMVTKFIPKLRACLKGGGWAETAKGQESGGTFIVGLLGKLYVIHSDYQVAEPNDPFVAVGCGEDLALGSLFASQGLPDLKQRVLTALQAAQRFSAGVREPFVLIESTYTKSA